LIVALIARCALSGSAAPDLISHAVEEVDEGRLESLNSLFEPAQTPLDWFSPRCRGVDLYFADTALQIFAGDLDPVSQNLDNLRPVTHRYRSMGTRDVRGENYPEGRHEMFNRRISTQ
jgi:alpha-beta hydrolase superfamily lysophospholipase